MGCRGGIWLWDMIGINRKVAKISENARKKERRVQYTQGAWEPASESVTMHRSGAWEKHTERVQAREGVCDAILIPGLFRSTPFDLSYQNWYIRILKSMKYMSNWKKLGWNTLLNVQPREKGIRNQISSISPFKLVLNLFYNVWAWLRA